MKRGKQIEFLEVLISEYDRENKKMQRDLNRNVQELEMFKEIWRELNRK